MSKFVAEFDIDNAAFDDVCTEETARILRGLADKLEADTPVRVLEHEGGRIPLFDVNGNRIGVAYVLDA